MTQTTIKQETDEVTTEIDFNVDMLHVETITDRVDELREILESRFVAGTNMAGFMPDSEPDTFATFDEAKRDVIGRIKQHEDEAETEALAEALAALAEATNLESKPFSVIHAGQVYWVTCEGDFEDDQQELEFLEGVLKEMQGYGGNHQWEGNWYPDYLIADKHFKDYAKQLAEDVCSAELRDAKWPLNCIDWDEAAEELKQDYSEITIQGYNFMYLA